MAIGISSLVVDSGSPLMGSPVFCKMKANLQENTTFHQAKLQVSVKRLSSGQVNPDIEETFEFSASVLGSGALSDDIYIDFSSALRAVSDTYEFTPHTEVGEKSHPLFTADVSAWDEFMIDGIYHSTYDSRISIQNTFYFIMGAWTDLQRLQSGKTKGVDTLTRKPVLGEIVPSNGPLVVYPKPYSYSDTNWHNGTVPSYPTDKAVAITGSVITLNGRIIHVVTTDEPYVAFQFVNGYGVIESIYAVTLPEEKIKKTVKEYTVSVPMQFNRINRNVVRKGDSRHIFAMSSGPVTEEWQRWWQEEFLNTPQAWMYINNMWLPVSIVPEEETAGINRAKDDLPEVLFTAKLNIDGL